MSNEHNNTNTDHRNDLHLTEDPQLIETQSLLELLAKQDRSAMPMGLEYRVLDAVSATFAPAPISLAQSVTTEAHEQSNSNNFQGSGFQSSGRFWSMRIAAAAVLVTGTTLLVVGTKPWANSPVVVPAHEIALASIQNDFDEFLALESMDDGHLSEAVTDWEIWAQSVDSDLDTSLIGFDWYDFNSEDGAL